MFFFNSTIKHLQGPHVVMALELCSTDLHQVLRSAPSSVPLSVVKRCMQQLLQGVAAIHAASASRCRHAHSYSALCDVGKQRHTSLQKVATIVAVVLAVCH